jgi:hypothetical protein
MNIFPNEAYFIFIFDNKLVWIAFLETVVLRPSIRKFPDEISLDLFRSVILRESKFIHKDNENKLYFHIKSPNEKWFIISFKLKMSILRPEKWASNDSR